jgi:hypothetical protein
MGSHLGAAEGVPIWSIEHLARTGRQRRSLIGTGARKRRALVRAKPGGCSFFEASIDPIAERRARCRRKVLSRRRVHLRHDRHLDPGRWRRRRHRVKSGRSRRNHLR